MKIFLSGYMGSGKSLIGKRLSTELNHTFIDLDDHIELIEDKSVYDIFRTNGELYFRKLESKVLKDILEEKADLVVSLGGGTPCYGRNLDLIKDAENTVTVYLKASVEELTKRLFSEKLHRPVISHLETIEDLEEFIRKHLFERAYYYLQSDIIIPVDKQNEEAIIQRIKENL